MRILSQSAFCVEVQSFWLVEALRVLADCARECLGDETDGRPDCDEPWEACLGCGVTRCEREAMSMVRW